MGGVDGDRGGGLGGGEVVRQEGRRVRGAEGEREEREMGERQWGRASFKC